MSLLTSTRFASAALAAAVLLPALAGCDGPQSVFEGAGPSGRNYGLLGTVMILGGGAILALVVILIALAMLAPPLWRRRLGSNGFILLGGVAFPVVVLTALLAWELPLTRASADAVEETPVRIEVTGEQFWWRVRYFDDDGRLDFETANEIRLPSGAAAELSLTSADVIHSFWVPALGGKLDMIPGRVNRLRLVADRPGVYRGQCSEYCGAQHALMAFDVVVTSDEDYVAWLAVQRQEADEPRLSGQREGRDLFMMVGCAGCHAVRGTEAAGTLGPDLTHIGSRRTIAAGTLPNNVGTLAGWIASAQHIKRGNRMPSFNTLAGTELRAIATWLSELQ